MINELKILAEKYMSINKNDLAKYKKYKLISEILKQKDCFLNMSIDEAYSILRDLDIPEDRIRYVYEQLI